LKLKIKQQKGRWCTLVIRRERKKKQMTTCDNSTTILLYAPHHVKRETVVYPVRRWKSRFGHRVTSHVSPEWRGLHPLAGLFGTHANIFLNKKIEKKTWKIPKHLMNLLITQNIKIAPKTKLIFFFLSFLRLKTCFHYTWIMEKL